MSDAARELLRAGGVPVRRGPRPLHARARRAGGGRRGAAGRAHARRRTAVPAVLDEAPGARRGARARGARRDRRARRGDGGDAPRAPRRRRLGPRRRPLGTPVVVKAAARDLPHKARRRAPSASASRRRRRRAPPRSTRSSRPPGRRARRSRARSSRRRSPAGREVIVGARRDPVFGPVLVVGPGGAGVEELGSDAARRLLPLAEGEADALAAGLGGRRSLAAAIESVEQLALALGDELEALELNPVVLGERRDGDRRRRRPAPPRLRGRVEERAVGQRLARDAADRSEVLEVRHRLEQPRDRLVGVVDLAEDAATDVVRASPATPRAPRRRARAASRPPPGASRRRRRDPGWGGRDPAARARRRVRRRGRARRGTPRRDRANSRSRTTARRSARRGRRRRGGARRRGRGRRARACGRGSRACARGRARSRPSSRRGAPRTAAAGRARRRAPPPRRRSRAPRPPARPRRARGARARRRSRRGRPRRR